jgi:DNA-binding CsgD family transcriptional regulator/tetratricopeptide (TPR) repeat protein
LHTRHQLTRLTQLAEERGNLRAALDWFDQTKRSAELTRACWALFWFWWFRGLSREATGWYERVLSRDEDLPAALRSAALFGAAQFAWTLGDADRAEALSREALELEHTTGQPFLPGLPALMLSVVASMRGDSAEATALGKAAVDSLRQVQTWEGRVWLRIALNDVGLHTAQLLPGAEGTALIEEALTNLENGDDPYLAGVHWSDLGLAAQATGDALKAERCYVEGLRLLHAVGGDWYLATPLAGLATIEVTRDAVWAARLFGAAEALRERSGQPNWPLERDRDEQTVVLLRALLGEDRLAQERSTGRSMPLSAIIARVETEQRAQPTLSSPPELSMAGKLSSREREVLRLIVAGQSDREIAATLYIAPRTASKHVSNILAKLDVTSRSEAAVLAVRQGLA